MTEPFPGLRPFRKDEHEFFFGRDEHTAALYRFLDRGRLLAILGGSGSGKSSLILAGLLPLLEQEKRNANTPRWSIVTLRPGVHPIRRLASALLETAECEDESIQRVISGLHRTSRGLADEIDRLLPGASEVLILVDQFEELFRYADTTGRDAIDNRDPEVAKLSRDDELRRFVEVLLRAAASSERNIRVVVTMRSDFLGDCARFRGLAEAVSANQYLAPWLDRDEQTEAIVGPLLRSAGRLDAGVFELNNWKVKDWSDLIEPQLVEQLVNDAGDEPDQLPVLQHALRRCWSDASGQRLTLQAYRKLGGWGVILSNHADEVMQGCGAGREETVERIFRALVQRDGNGRAIRRPCTIAQLVDETGERETDVREVIGQFSSSDCSFLTPPTPPHELIDIGHEALIRQWRKIADPTTGWLQEESRDGIIWQQLLFRAQGYAENSENVLSPLDVKQRLPWFEKHNTHWADRYGGQWALVDKFLCASNLARQGAHRKKVVDRAVKITIAVFLIGILGAIFQLQEVTRDKYTAMADSIGFQLDFRDDEVEPGDMKALMELATTEPSGVHALIKKVTREEDLRLAFIDRMSDRQELAERFARNASMVTRSLVGLDPVRRRAVITHTFGPKSGAPEMKAALYERALLGIELEAPESVGTILAALRETTDPENLKPLGEGLSSLPADLTEIQAEQAITSILAALEKPADLKSFRSLGEGLAALSEKLTAAQAMQAADLFLDALERTKDPHALGSIGQGLAAFGFRLKETQAQHAVGPILNAMRKKPHSIALKGLGQGLAALPVELTDAMAGDAIDPFLGAIRQTTDSAVLLRLAEGLSVLPARLTEAQAEQVIERFLTVTQKTTQSNDLKQLAEGFATLPVELADAQANRAVEYYLAAMERATQSKALKRLGEGLAALPVALTDAQARQAVKQILAGMKTTHSHALKGLGEALTVLPVVLTEAEAMQAVERFRFAMAKNAMNELNDDPFALKRLCEGIAMLPVELTAAQAEETVKWLLDAIGSTTELYGLEPLGDGLAALSSKLNEPQAERAVQQILTAMRKRSDPDGLARLAQGVSVLYVEFTEAEAEEVATTILAAMQNSSDPNTFEVLGASLATVASKVEERLASRAADQIIAVMQRTTDSDALRHLSEGLVMLTSKLSDTQAAQRVIDAMKIPWMVGSPSEPLMQALLGGSRGEVGESTPSLWQIIALIEQRFGSKIDLTGLPRGSTQLL